MGMVVACAGYENGSRIADFDIEESGRFARGEGRFVWIGLHEPSVEILGSLQKQFGLHDLAVEDAFRAHQRPKIEAYDDTLFVVLRTAQMEGETIAFGETHIFIGSGYVITVRHGASSSYGEVRERAEHMPKFLRHGEDFVLYALMDFVVDNYMPIVDAVEARVEQIEDEVREDRASRDTIERIAALRRDLLHLRRAASPLLDVCNRLQRMDLPCINQQIRPYYRDVHDHVINVNESIDILREQLAAAFETYLLLASNRQNDVTRQLAGWAAILAVPTAVAGIYGMNFEHMPELHLVWGYPAVLLAVAGVCLALYLKFRRMGWI
ncbi:MAG: magnesium/cobalt transporter CorA [Rhodospirillales bacterium]